MIVQQAIRRAFSLLEVMLVLAIIAIMTAAVAYNLIGASERAKIKATQSFLGTVQNAIKSYQIDKSALPGSLSILQQGGKMSYLDADKKLVDAWGRDFLYSTQAANGHDYQLYSKGPDGVFPSADDIDVWKVQIGQ